MYDSNIIPQFSYTTIPRCHQTILSQYHNTTVLLYYRVPPCHKTIISQYQYNTTPLYCSSSIQRYRSTNIAMHQCSNVSVHHYKMYQCAIVPMYHCVTVSMHCPSAVHCPRSVDTCSAVSSSLPPSVYTHPCANPVSLVPLPCCGHNVCRLVPGPLLWCRDNGNICHPRALLPQMRRKELLFITSGTCYTRRYSIKRSFICCC